ncbi:MAG: aminomethyl-transferring glycine dehydrogenase [Candidatus Neomarinimicrobiota bacterium]
MAHHTFPHDSFIPRHIGPSAADIAAMLKLLNLPSLEALVKETIPASIQSDKPLNIRRTDTSEKELIDELRTIANKNNAFRSFIGQGYYGTITPFVILRNILENPGWYTQYTPYQAEISQGRLEALLNFQTMITDLTGLKIANASLLDEGTAAAEAMTMFFRETKLPKRNRFFVHDGCHPQTIDILKTRALPLGIELKIEKFRNLIPDDKSFGILLQYPASDGAVYDYSDLCETAHSNGTFVAVAADIMSLVLLKPPGEFGADVAVGNTQRFGVPMGFGGPHAAYFATRDQFKRKIPGRIIGVSVDRHGHNAFRMALQTREQHIRREKATSNICTAQVLLAIMASMYAVYHGPERLKQIANKIYGLTDLLGRSLMEIGYEILNTHYFDTLRIKTNRLSSQEITSRARKNDINLRYFTDETIGISIDETTTLSDIHDLVKLFSPDINDADSTRVFNGKFGKQKDYSGPFLRTSSFLTHPIFNSYHSETEILRYIHRLESKDLALNTSMIPLGSCTMKLNATAEMIPVTWGELSDQHPFAPVSQSKGYQQIINDLGDWLKEITGFPAISMQPNSGAQGEYTGLMVIRAYHHDHGDNHRNICLIPASAHGTNPASSIMAGMDVLVVNCDDNGNVDVKDLRQKAESNSDRLAALMVTYPSTHGVFEEEIQSICDIIHANGGLVYMDGANLNAMVGLCRPAEFGADVIHINLHKTFSIPHGGGGPGMGPICTTASLAPFLPNHPMASVGGVKGITAVSSAPWGSVSILPISWTYIALLNGIGLAFASQIAILNANYMATRLGQEFPILYKGLNNRVAHEFILDLRQFRKSSGITDEDVAKRLIDYGFHAPTMSFPVPGTLMIEPTESESKAELDRLCEALISIKQEITEIAEGRADRIDNVLKNAPHTAKEIASENWKHPYSRETAAFPAPWTRDYKFWPSVGRVDNAYGDRNLICVCPPIEDYADGA